MRKDYQYDVLAEGLAIPVPPIWGKDNDPQQWWRINDYEILCAAFHHEIEMFLKSFAPYLPKGEKELRPTTPQKTLINQPAISEPLPLKKFKSAKNVTFPKVLPISSLTSSTRLGAMIAAASADLKDFSGTQYPPQKSWNISDNESDNPFDKTDSSKE